MGNREQPNSRENYEQWVRDITRLLENTPWYEYTEEQKAQVARVLFSMYSQREIITYIWHRMHEGGYKGLP